MNMSSRLLSIIFGSMNWVSNDSNSSTDVVIISADFLYRIKNKSVILKIVSVDINLKI